MLFCVPLGGWPLVVGPCAFHMPSTVPGFQDALTSVSMALKSNCCTAVPLYCRRLLANDPPHEVKHFMAGPYIKVTTPFPEGKLVGWAGSWFVYRLCAHAVAAGCCCSYTSLFQDSTPARRLSLLLCMDGHGAVCITPHQPPMPLQVYDFVFDKERGKWAAWMETLEHKALDPEAEYTNIIVPTGGCLVCWADGSSPASSALLP